MEKECLLFLCQALEHSVEQHIHTAVGLGVEGLLAACALRERPGGGVIRDSACCEGNRLSLVLGGDIS